MNTMWCESVFPAISIRNDRRTFFRGDTIASSYMQIASAASFLSFV